MGGLYFETVIHFLHGPTKTVPTGPVPTCLSVVTLTNVAIYLYICDYMLILSVRMRRHRLLFLL